MKASSLTFIFSFLIIGFFFAQNTTAFNGKIHFKQTKGSTQMSFNYFVKGENVRIEELNEQGKVVGIQLINTKEKDLLVVSPERKLYLEAKKRRSPVNFDVEVVKTQKKKTILDYDCFEVVAINKQQDRKIVYWVTQDNFSFFYPLLEVLNKKEKQSLYFRKIKGMEDCWPIRSTEYVISTGKPIAKQTTIAIENKTLDNSLFVIPKDYSKFEN